MGSVTMLLLIPFILLLIVVCVFLIIRWGTTCNAQIPKIIWCYWHEKELPPLLAFCVSTWHKWNPDHEVNILCNDDAKRFGILSYKHANNPTRISDFIRLHVLEQYGGIWVDISTVMNAPLSWVHEKHGQNPQTEIIGFYLGGWTSDNDSPFNEGWFIAAPKNSRFVRLWNNEFKRSNTFATMDDYIANVTTAGVKLEKHYHNDYYTMNISAQVVMQKLIQPDVLARIMDMDKAEDGPYKYLADNDWDMSKSVEYFGSGKYKSESPFVKLRSIERRQMQECKESDSPAFYIHEYPVCLQSKK